MATTNKPTQLMLDILKQMDSRGPVAIKRGMMYPEWSQSGALVSSYLGRVTYSTFVALDSRGLVSHRVVKLIDGRIIREYVITESREAAARVK